MRHVINKFKVAFEGILQSLKLDRGVRLQFALALITVFVSFFLNLTMTEWLVILICIGAVLTAELFNTAIEELVDASKSNLSDTQRKRIKDISAGAVLMMSLISFIIMCLILISKGVQ